jgi:hypothetical protein
MKTKSLVYIIILLTGAYFQGFAQETKSNRLSGGMGYFMFGYAGFNLESMNTQFTNNGYPELANGSITFGGGGHFVYQNFIFGGEGHGNTGRGASNTNYNLKLNVGYGFFNFGYIIYHSPGINIYPMLGFGGGGATIAITGKNRHPENFDDLLDDPARESYITNYGFLINFSIGADYIISGIKTKTTSGGWLVGVKAGYILKAGGDDWYFNDNKIAGAPNAGISGPYVRLTFGGGGLGTK